MKKLPIELAGQELLAELRKLPAPQLGAGSMSVTRVEQFIDATIAAISELRQQVKDLQRQVAGTQGTSGQAR